MIGRKPRTTEEWIVRLNAGAEQDLPLTDAERQELSRWLAAHPGRLKQLKLTNLIWKLGRRLPHTAAAQIDVSSVVSLGARLKWLAADVRDALWRPLGVAGFVAAAACVMAVVLMPANESNHLKNHSVARTDIGQISDYVLPDNTEITVAANSSVEVDFSKQHRAIRLDRGEVFLNVEHDHNHPFVITVGNHDVVVTGTQLNVSYDQPDNAVEVAVVEGSINVVRHSNILSETQPMTAGEVILFPAVGSPVHRNLTPDQAAAWRTRQLYFDGARLSEVLTAVNRYVEKPLVAEGSDVQNLTLTGEFTAGDTSTLLYSLEKLYGIVVHDEGDHVLLTKHTDG